MRSRNPSMTDHPLPDPSTKQLLKLLDTIGTEEQVRSVLVGRSLATHLHWLQSRHTSATTS